MKYALFALTSVFLSNSSFAQSSGELLSVISKKENALKRVCMGTSEDQQAHVKLAIAIPNDLTKRDELRAKHIKNIKDLDQYEVNLNEAIQRNNEQTETMKSEIERLKKLSINTEDLQKSYANLIEINDTQSWLCRKSLKRIPGRRAEKFIVDRTEVDDKDSFELAFEVTSSSSSLSGPVIASSSASRSVDFKPGKWNDDRTEVNVWNITIMAPWLFLKEGEENKPMLKIVDGEGSLFFYDGQTIPLNCRDLE
ncbi:MAG: hypothetical protein KA715_04530 [Xanthomonadaceae bacterium]|nr:hypothetical protein [Xanthomonadaceae bacterium]